MKICLIEDDLELGRALQSALQAAGDEVVWVRLGVDARQRMAQQDFDAILLDLGLPDASGLTLLRQFRSAGQRVPIIIITARETLDDRLEGLDAGADDFLVKPFATPELLARLRAVVRRGSAWDGGEAALWTLQDLVLDARRLSVTRAGQAIELSRTEFALLLMLMRFPDRVLTRREIETRALAGNEGQALDVHMSNLRKKIGEGYIRTVRGVGYAVLEK